jgi:succinyl-CoA synthetase alpha subunit
MIPGSTFIDYLPMFEADAQTEVIVIIGEIGGSDEEIAAQYIKNYVKKPVVALIAGKNAPRGTSMGHAGAIVAADGTGSAENKEVKLSQAGAIIAESTEDIVKIVSGILKK